MYKDKSVFILKVLSYIVFTLFVICTIYPLVQAILISFKTTQDFTMNPIGLPSRINFQNYIDAWEKGNFSLLFKNSVVITFFTIVLTIFIASPAGFALAKLNLKGGKIIYNYFILGMIIPVQVIMIPLMKMGRHIGMANSLTYIILIFTATGLAFPLIIYTSFYKGIPTEIIEAAKIDGCNIFYLFMKIIFPITAVVNSTVAIIAGMFPWKDFFIPLVFASDDKVRTLTVGLAKFSGNYFTDWTTVFAALIIQSIPIIVLFLILQKNFIEGVASGAVKG
jgi:raffinose/stachyose/melibiose transport system permease protein